MKKLVLGNRIRILDKRIQRNASSGERHEIMQEVFDYAKKGETTTVEF